MPAAHVMQRYVAAAQAGDFETARALSREAEIGLTVIDALTGGGT